MHMLLQGVDWDALSSDQKALLEAGSTVAWEALQNWKKMENTSSSSSSEWSTNNLIGSPNVSIPIAAIISYSYVAANIPAEVSGTESKCNDKVSGSC